MKDIINLKNLDVKREYQTFRSIVKTFLKNYKAKNPWKIRLIDSFIAFSVVIFIIQFIYIVVAGLFPLNSIISGLLCSLGTITLLGN
jgi:oligosaccharyltransferase complex subunit epsilon